MHELAVTESVLEIACRHAKKAQAKKVTDIHLVIGQLSSIVDDSIQFYWNLISEGTLCENSQLHFRRIPAKLICQACGTQYTLDGELTPCPKCHSARVKVTSGDEFNLESIDIQK